MQILNYFIVVAVEMKKNNIEILSIYILLALAIIVRLGQENKMSVKRKSLRNWIFLIASFVLIISSYIIVVPSISLILKLISFLFSAFSIIFSSSRLIYQISDTIEQSGLVYTVEEASGPSKGEMLWHGVEEARERYNSKPQRKKSNIKHIIAVNKIFFISGVPVFAHKFKWVMSITARNEQFYHIQNRLSEFFPQYNWSGSKNGKYWVLFAFPKGNKPLIQNYTSKYSNIFPWYIVPIGSSDCSTKKDRTNSLYLWKLHEGKTKEELAYKSLLKTKEYSNNDFIESAKPAPMALIIGGTGGGKSVLLKTIISHFIIHNVDLYISDPKGGAEFGLLKCIPNIKNVGITLEENYEIFKEFLLSMFQRYQSMGKLGISELPLNGIVDIGNRISIGGIIFNRDEEVIIENNNNIQKTITAEEIQPGMKVVIRGNKDFNVPDHWVLVTTSNYKNGGKYFFRPMVFIADEYAQLVSEKNNSKIAINMIDEIKSTVDAISRLGRAANIHMIIATQSATNSLFSNSFKNNIHFKVICGAVPQDISRLIIGSEDGENIPSSPAGMSLFMARDRQNLSQAMYTKTEDILRVSNLNNNYIKSIKNGTVSIPKKEIITFEVFEDAQIRKNVTQPEIKTKQVLKIGNKQVKVNDSKKDVEVTINKEVVSYAKKELSVESLNLPEFSIKSIEGIITEEEKMENYNSNIVSKDTTSLLSVKDDSFIEIISTDDSEIITGFNSEVKLDEEKSDFSDDLILM